MRRFDLHQALAEKKSRRLILAMVVMQVLTVVLCSAFISLTFALIYWGCYPETAFPNIPVVYFAASFSALAVSFAIATGAYMKMSELDGGGVKIAEGLRGELVDETNLHISRAQRRLLNVVQELAIASSIPAPPVYVLSAEPGINALAAGHSTEDAVIVVTSGALRHLSRDQLQGMIAHEFSHILNGDISRDMWLTAATHGNYFLLVTAQEMSRYERYDMISFEAWMGYMLMPFGFMGACLARYFTAKVKRQNEFMADATAVELARYPQGLSEALMMIGGFEHKGRVKRSEAIETGHMFLVDSGTGWFGMHPPLDQRIIRLRPDWDGYYLYENADELDHYGGVYGEITELVGLGRQAARKKQFKDTITEVAPMVVAGLGASMAGSNASAPIRQTESLRSGSGDAEIPRWMAHDPIGAIEIDDVYRQLVNSHQGSGLALAAIRLDQFDSQRQSEIIKTLNPLVSGAVAQILAPISQLQDDQKIWIFDRAIETIVDAPAAVRTLFLEFVDQASVAVEDETDLARWAWQRIVQRKMSSAEAPAARLGDLQPMAAEVMILLSTVTHTDAEGEALSEYNFMRAIAHTGLNRSVLVPHDELQVPGVELAVEHLSYLSARQRRVLIVACTASVVANRSTNMEEAWVLRAICEGFNFPMPCVLPGHAFTSGV